MGYIKKFWSKQDKLDRALLGIILAGFLSLSGGLYLGHLNEAERDNCKTEQREQCSTQKLSPSECVALIHLECDLGL